MGSAKILVLAIARAASAGSDDEPPLPAALDRRGAVRLFYLREANGQALSYVFYEEEPDRRSAAKLLSKDEARRIASNVAKLSELLRKT